MQSQILDSLSTRLCVFIRWARICMCLAMKHEVCWSWDVGIGMFFLLCVFLSCVCVCMCLSSLCAEPNRALCLALLSRGSGCQSGSRPVRVCRAYCLLIVSFSPLLLATAGRVWGSQLKPSHEHHRGWGWGLWERSHEWCECKQVAWWAAAASLCLLLSSFHVFLLARSQAVDDQCGYFNSIEQLRERPTHLLVFLQHVILQFDPAPLVRSAGMTCSLFRTGCMNKLAFLAFHLLGYITIFYFKIAL